MNIVTLKEAREKGLVHYFTGKPCKYGHVAERLTCNKTCCVCRKSIDSRSYQKHRESRLGKVKSYYDSNAEKIKQYQRHYGSKPENKKLINTRHKRRYQEDPVYKAMWLMRGHTHKLLSRYNIPDKRYVKSTRVDYSPADLVKHLEKLFQPGMTWENHGQWHIDHVIPISVLTDWGIYDQKIINALYNLKPKWAEENMSKGNRFIG
jgi:hypothetical protein